MIETISIATEYRFGKEQEYADFASFKSLKGFLRLIMKTWKVKQSL
jgi:hypothetical protein